MTISILIKQWILVSITPFTFLSKSHTSPSFILTGKNRAQDYWDHLLLTLSVSVLITFFGPLELPVPLQ